MAVRVQSVTVQELYDTMTPDQKEACHYMVGAAVGSAQSLAMPTAVECVYNSMTQMQRYAVHFLVSKALMDRPL